MSEKIPEEDNRNESPGVDLASPTISASIVGTSSRTVIPPDLLPLQKVDSLYVKQKFDRTEMRGVEQDSKYIVQKGNRSFLPLYHIKEESGCCCANCVVKTRCFDAIIDDYEGHSVHLHRSRNCNRCFCCPTCLSTLTVTSSTGELYGTIRQTWSICFSKFTVENGQGESVFKIKGPRFKTGCCCCYVKYPIVSKFSGDKIGIIFKKWSGCYLQTTSCANGFGISFPKDLDLKMKMVLLAAAVLIDYDICDIDTDNQCCFTVASVCRRRRNYFGGVSW